MAAHGIRDGLSKSEKGVGLSVRQKPLSTWLHTDGSPGGETGDEAHRRRIPRIGYHGIEPRRSIDSEDGKRCTPQEPGVRESDAARGTGSIELLDELLSVDVSEADSTAVFGPNG